VNASSSVKISGVQILTPSNIGIFVGGSKDVNVEGSKIEGVMHHGFHVQGASENVVVQKNYIKNSARDAISVIDWGSDVKSKNIKFLNNIIQYANVSGIRGK